MFLLLLRCTTSLLLSLAPTIFIWTFVACKTFSVFTFVSIFGSDTVTAESWEILLTPSFLAASSLLGSSLAAALELLQPMVDARCQIDVFAIDGSGVNDLPRTPADERNENNYLQQQQ